MYFIVEAFHIKRILEALIRILGLYWGSENPSYCIYSIILSFLIPGALTFAFPQSHNSVDY